MWDMTTIKQVCVGVAIAGAVVGAGSAVGSAVASADSSGSDSTNSAGPASPGPQSRATSPNHAAKSPAAAATKAQRANAGPAATATAAARTAKATASVPLAATALPAPAAPRRALFSVLPLMATPAVPPGPARTATASASAANLRGGANAVAALLPSPPPSTHVLLIGTDGTNLDKILADPDFLNGGFKMAMDDGITSATSIVGHTTISGPSWTTILTGVWDNKSGVINNLFDPKPYDKWPTVINLLENKYGDNVKTSVVADWQYINDIGAAGGYPADDNEYFAFTNSWANTDQLVVDYTKTLIATTGATDANFIFSYQVQVDEAGHAYGGGSPEYAQAVNNVSGNIKDPASDPCRSEDWTVIITTDHGHQQSQGFGHGFQSPNETSSFVIFDLAGDAVDNGKQNLGYTNTDITPTIVSLFNVAQRGDFDGVPLTTKNTSNVKPTDLKQALNDAVSKYGYPNIGTDLALGTRTIFASVPYFLDGFVTSVTDQLQGIVDQNIFLISALAGVTKALVQITGDLGVAVTQAIARVVAHLTGAGTIPPSDPPLPPPAAGSPSPAQLLLLPAAAVA